MKISNKQNNKTIYRIALYGDSLISQTNERFDFASRVIKKINSEYSSILFDIIVCSNSKYTLKLLIDNLNDCLVYKPHSIIVLWDSDRETIFSGNGSNLNDYKSDLSIFIETMKKNVSNIAISGTTTFGELSQGQNAYDNTL